MSCTILNILIYFKNSWNSGTLLNGSRVRLVRWSSSEQTVAVTLQQPQDEERHHPWPNWYSRTLRMNLQVITPQRFFCDIYLFPRHSWRKWLITRTKTNLHSPDKWRTSKKSTTKLTHQIARSWRFSDPVSLSKVTLTIRISIKLFYIVEIKMLVLSYGNSSIRLLNQLRWSGWLPADRH